MGIGEKLKKIYFRTESKKVKEELIYMDYNATIPVDPSGIGREGAGNKKEIHSGT